MRIKKELCIIVVLFLLVFTVACASTSLENSQSNSRNATNNKTTPTPEKTPIKLSLELRLNENQKKTLKDSIPDKIKNFLEEAESLELLAQFKIEKGKVVYSTGERSKVVPNYRVDLFNSTLRKKVLESFYHSVAKGSPPANCFIPHHLLRARRGNDLVEIDICFSCSRFEGRGAFGKFRGTTERGSEKAENMFNNLIKTRGVSID